MKEESKKFLNDLLKSASPSGYEEESTEIFKEYCRGFDNANMEFIDKIGNCVFSIGDMSSKNPKKIMISGHIDEIGLQVIYITDDGFIKFTSLGGIDKKVLPGSIVYIINDKGEKIKGVIGKKPIHVETPDERHEVNKFEDLIIDIGTDNKEETLKLVSIGNPIIFNSDIDINFGNNKIVSRGLDDKIGVFITAEVLRRLNEEFESYPGYCSLEDKIVYCVSNVQEEVGLRGAMISSNRINPDISIDIDVTFATDEGRDINPGIYGEIKLGKGVVIENGPDKSKRLVKLMKDIANKNNISYQISCCHNGGTNTSAIQENSFDCETILLSIPNRNMHTQVEICDWRDVESCIDLIVAIIKEL